MGSPVVGSTALDASGLSLTVVETPSLGDRSYVVHDGTVALVVDPQRDLDRVLAVTESAGVSITDVFETHIHNDYVTGGFALAQHTGARYHVNADDPVAFARTSVRNGDLVMVSELMRMRALATPGHTFSHLAFLLEARRHEDEEFSQIGVFTGGSLLYGGAGRPDLLGPEHTAALARHQYGSARLLAQQVRDAALVLPTHGFGSFCSSDADTGNTDSSTIGEEKTLNPALQLDESTWVAQTLAGLDAYPSYYSRMGPENLRGPDAADLAPPQLADRDAIAAQLTSGGWVVDLRSRTAFAAGHVVGSLNFGIDGQFATYLGWLLPWETSLVLLGETAGDVAEAQRELSQIGIDGLAGTAIGEPTDWTTGRPGTFPRASFADLATVRHHRKISVLDVRRDNEFRESHLSDVTHIPLHALLTRLDEAPDGEVWVHCQSGYRASIAGSVLSASGRAVVVVDDTYDPDGLRDLGVLSDAA